MSDKYHKFNERATGATASLLEASRTAHLIVEASVADMYTAGFITNPEVMLQLRDSKVLPMSHETVEIEPIRSKDDYELIA